MLFERVWLKRNYKKLSKLERSLFDLKLKKEKEVTLDELAAKFKGYVPRELLAEPQYRVDYILKYKEDLSVFKMLILEHNAKCVGKNSVYKFETIL